MNYAFRAENAIAEFIGAKPIFPPHPTRADRRYHRGLVLGGALHRRDQDRELSKHRRQVRTMARMNNPITQVFIVEANKEAERIRGRQAERRARYAAYDRAVWAKVLA